MLEGATVFYGGGFDPPHLAHQMTLLYLLEGLSADAVWMAPAFVHPFGKPMVAFEHRLAMCELAAQPFAERVQVSDVEQTLGGQGRTFDTLTHLRAAHPQRRWALAIGADNAAIVHKWYRWREITEMAQVVILGRAGVASTTALPVELPALASRDVRERLGRGESVEGLVPSSVAAYIAAQKLYR